MTAFKRLDAATRDRLARYGIDPDRSYDAFIDEVRVQPPNALLRDLGLTRTPSNREIAAPNPRLAATGITERETEVLLAMAEGLSNREIASELHVSVETVKTYVARIYMHLSARNRAHAVAAAYHTGLLLPKRAA